MREPRGVIGECKEAEFRLWEFGDPGDGDVNDISTAEGPRLCLGVLGEVGIFSGHEM